MYQVQAKTEGARIPEEAVEAEVTKMIEHGAADEILGLAEAADPR